MTLRDLVKQRQLAGGEEHDRHVVLLGDGPEPVDFAILHPVGGFACDVEAHAEHVQLVAPHLHAFGLLRIVEDHRSHGGEAARIAPRRFLPIVDALAFQSWRHDHHAIDARRVDHRKHALDRVRLRSLRPRVRRPGPLGCIRLPHVDLRIHDDPLFRRLLGEGGRRGRCGGAECGLEKSTACEHGGDSQSLRRLWPVSAHRKSRFHVGASRRSTSRFNSSFTPSLAAKICCARKKSWTRN